MSKKVQFCNEVINVPANTTHVALSRNAKGEIFIFAYPSKPVSIGVNGYSHNDAHEVAKVEINNMNRDLTASLQDVTNNTGEMPREESIAALVLSAESAYKKTKEVIKKLKANEIELGEALHQLYCTEHGILPEWLEIVAKHHDNAVGETPNEDATKKAVHEVMKQMPPELIGLLGAILKS